jgi:hypothetical protein
MSGSAGRAPAAVRKEAGELSPVSGAVIPATVSD